MTLQEYIEWYKDHYGNSPGFKCVESFKKLSGIEEKEPEAVDNEIEFEFLK